MTLPVSYESKLSMGDSTGNSFGLIYPDSSFFYTSQSTIVYTPNFVNAEVQKDTLPTQWQSGLVDLRGEDEGVMWRELQYDDLIHIGYYTGDVLYKWKFDDTINQAAEKLEKIWVRKQKKTARLKKKSARKAHRQQ